MFFGLLTLAAMAVLWIFTVPESSPYSVLWLVPAVGYLTWFLLVGLFLFA